MSDVEHGGRRTLRERVLLLQVKEPVGQCVIHCALLSDNKMRNSNVSVPVQSVYRSFIGFSK